MTYTIYHNPKCSKSCAARDALENSDAPYDVGAPMLQPDVALACHQRSTLPRDLGMTQAPAPATPCRGILDR